MKLKGKSILVTLVALFIVVSVVGVYGLMVQDQRLNDPGRAALIIKSNEDNTADNKLIAGDLNVDPGLKNLLDPKKRMIQAQGKCDLGIHTGSSEDACNAKDGCYWWDYNCLSYPKYVSDNPSHGSLFTNFIGPESSDSIVIIGDIHVPKSEIVAKDIETKKLISSRIEVNGLGNMNGLVVRGNYGGIWTKSTKKDSIGIYVDNTGNYGYGEGPAHAIKAVNVGEKYPAVWVTGAKGGIYAEEYEEDNINNGYGPDDYGYGVSGVARGKGSVGISGYSSEPNVKTYPTISSGNDVAFRDKAYAQGDTRRNAGLAKPEFLGKNIGVKGQAKGSNSYGMWSRCEGEGCIGLYADCNQNFKYTEVYETATGNRYKMERTVGNCVGIFTDDLTQFTHGKDIAEGFMPEGKVEPADVVVAVAGKKQTIKRSERPYDTTVIGILSTDPSIQLKIDKGEELLAIAGTLPVKATTENGPIIAGDLLVTSSKPGHVMRCDDKIKCFGAVVGKALEDLKSGDGKIEAIVTLG